MITAIKPYTFTKSTTPKFKLDLKNKTVILETYADDCTFERHYSDGLTEKGTKNEDGTYTYKLYKKEINNGIPVIKTIY